MKKSSALVKHLSPFFASRLIAFAGALISVHASAAPSDCSGRILSQVRFGDLTSQEVSRIQDVVDRLQREVVVVGSAATGGRRNLGTPLPFAKGAHGRSDIDYVLPTAEPYELLEAEVFVGVHMQILTTLPDLDTRHSFLIHSPDESSPRVWFRPHLPVTYLGADKPNLISQPWMRYEAEIELLLRKSFDLVQELKKASARPERDERILATLNDSLAHLRAREELLEARRALNWEPKSALQNQLPRR